MLGALMALVLATPLSVLNIHTLIPLAEAAPKEWTVEDMKALAVEKAKAYGLKVQKFLWVVGCESNWDRFALGDEGTSFGLVQLRFPEKDWGITKEEAYNPEIALETMSLAWLRGEAYRWTCWRNAPSSF